MRVVEALREWSVASVSLARAGDESIAASSAAVGEPGSPIAFSRVIEKLADLRALAEALAHRLACLRAAGFLLPEPLHYIQAIGSAPVAGSAPGAHVKLEML